MVILDNLYEVINEIIDKREKSPLITNKLLVNGREVEDAERIADAFNDYFGVKLVLLYLPVTEIILRICQH